MPLGIAPSDKKLLWIGAAVLLVLVIGTLIFPSTPEELQSPVPSTFSVQPAGAQAAYRLLVTLHYPVQRWESPPMELEEAASGNSKGSSVSNILLILAEPSEPPSDKEKAALQGFVERGGHVLFTGSHIADYFAGASLSEINEHPVTETSTADIPSRFTRNAQRISLAPQARWSSPGASQVALYGDPDAPTVVTWQVDDGQITWWAGSTPLTNAGITTDDNLAFFLNAVGNWAEMGSKAEPYKIYWDEYFHGERRSLISYVRATSLIWAWPQLALLVVAILFTFSRRNGPVYIPLEVSRLSPLEFVDTLGGLYERAGAASSAVAVSYVRLRGLLTRQLSLASNTPDTQLAAAVEQRLGWKKSGLGESLQNAMAASQKTELPNGEALELVRELEAFAARLHVRAQFQRENT
jgi:hypothetical protein